MGITNYHITYSLSDNVLIFRKVPFDFENMYAVHSLLNKRKMIKLTKIYVFRSNFILLALFTRGYNKNGEQKH